MEEHAVKKKATVEDVATFLNVPRSWIYDRTRRGTIPHVQLGKYVRFDLDEVERWAKAGCPAKWHDEAEVTSDRTNNQ